jgi:general stress protein YciG
MTDLPHPKLPRGFALLDPEKRRAIARLGGSSVPNAKRSFATVPGLARSAGAKGGANVPGEKRRFSIDPDLAKRAGRIGGSKKRNPSPGIA